MKTLFSFLAVVLLCSMSVFAQRPVQDLPELQEWYSWSGAKGSYISYLPGFSDNGGMNAITQLRSGDPTWFNQFAYDTVSRFQWKELGSHYVVSVDFNNDGIPDYMDTRGRIYTGLQKGEMPNPEPVHTLSRGSFLWASVGDFNGDGYQDIFAPNSGKDFEIIFGGKNIAKIKRTILSIPSFSTSEQSQIINAYVNEEGKCRFICFRRYDFTEGFYLYGLSFEATPNDSVTVSLKQLSAIEENKSDKNQLIFPLLGSILLRQTLNSGFSLLALNNRDNVGCLYSITNDKFSLIHKFKSIGSTIPSPLQGSINKDSIVEFITPIVYKNIFYNGIYSGSLVNDTTVKAVIPLDKNRYGYMTFKLIGDVNGDGIQDIAGCSPEKLVFVVYLGLDWQKLSVVSDINKVDFTLRQTEPNPIGIGGTAVLPATLAHTGIYTLEVFDLTGKRLGEVFKGELPTGDVRIPFDVKALNTSSGMFTLRLSDGKHTQERTFVINR